MGKYQRQNDAQDRNTGRDQDANPQRRSNGGRRILNFFLRLGFGYEPNDGTAQAHIQQIQVRNCRNRKDPDSIGSHPKMP